MSEHFGHYWIAKPLPFEERDTDGGRAITYGTAFREDRGGGTFYSFDPEDGIEVVRCWPPRGWRLQPGQTWKGFHPDYVRIPQNRSLPRLLEGVQHRLATLSDPERTALLPTLLRQQALYRCLLTIPEEVRHVIRRFPNSHWNLLRLVAATGTPGLDLLNSTPALGLALAHSARFHNVQKPLRAWRALLGCGRNQLDIVRWVFGFAAARSTIRLLRKFDRRCLDPKVMKYARDILADPRLAVRAAHLPRLTRPAVLVLSIPALEAVASQQLLHELSAQPAPDAGWALFDMVRMMAILQLEGRGVGPLRSIDQIREVHDSLLERLNAEFPSDVVFPPAPISESAEIQYIQDSRQLRSEGTDMHHCIVSYLSRIKSGEYAVYRVASPERATLGLRRLNVSSDRWIIDDLRGEGNREVSEETRLTVLNWLAESSSLPIISGIEEIEVTDSFFDEAIPF